MIHNSVSPPLSVLLLLLCASCCFVPSKVTVQEKEEITALHWAISLPLFSFTQLFFFFLEAPLNGVEQLLIFTIGNPYLDVGGESLRHVFEASSAEGPADLRRSKVHPAHFFPLRLRIVSAGVFRHPWFSCRRIGRDGFCTLAERNASQRSFSSSLTQPSCASALVSCRGVDAERHHAFCSTQNPQLFICSNPVVFT